MQQSRTPPAPVGARLRRVRRLQRLTLQAVAGRAGVTRSLLSKIETGRSSPPVATLMRLAAALGVPVSLLLQESPGTGPVLVPAARTRGRAMQGTDKGYRFAALSAARGAARLQAFLFEAGRGQVRRRPLSHAGEELVHVLEGEMLYTVGAVAYRLRAGDTLCFDAGDDHDLEPLSRRVRYLAVFTER